MVKKAKKQKRDEEGDSQYRERRVGTPGATGEVDISTCELITGECISWYAKAIRELPLVQDSSLDRGAMESSAASTSNDSKNASDSSQEAKDR